MERIPATLFELAVVTILIGFTISHESLYTNPIADDKPIEICGANNYDVSNLTKAAFWQFSQTGGCYNGTSTDLCTFYFTFCKPLEAAGGSCNGSSICQASEADPNDVISLGKYNPNPFLRKSDIGFVAAFPGGSAALTYDKKPCNISTLLDFNCQTTASWSPSTTENDPSPVPTQFFNITYASDTCVYLITAWYAGACLNIEPGQPSPGASPGTVLIIVFAVLIACYLIFGMAYNGVVSKERGVRLIPHYRLWASVPGFAKDGCTTMVSCITCGMACKNASAEKYEDI